MISVIIIEYNTALRCLKYIIDLVRVSDIPDLSFVVVDNSVNTNNWIKFDKQASSCGFVQQCQGEYINKRCISYSFKTYMVEYLINDCNSGFAKANNVGAKLAIERYNPSYLLFSNSDIILPENFTISILVDDMQIEGCGIVGPKVIGLDKKDQSPGKKINIFFRHIIPEFLWPINKTIPFIKNINSDTIHNAERGFYYRIIGAFILMRTDTFNMINGFDENTFLYAEEPILSERLKNIGKKAFFDPTVEIIHEQGKSTNNKSISTIDNIIIKRKRVFESEMYYYEYYLRCGNICKIIARFSLNIYMKKLMLLNKITKVYYRVKERNA